MRKKKGIKGSAFRMCLHVTRKKNPILLAYKSLDGEMKKIRLGHEGPEVYAHIKELGLYPVDNGNY